MRRIRSESSCSSDRDRFRSEYKYLASVYDRVHIAFGLDASMSFDVEEEHAARGFDTILFSISSFLPFAPQQGHDVLVASIDWSLLILTLALSKRP